METDYQYTYVKKKLKEFLNEFKKLNFRAISVLEYKKRNRYKIFHLSAKLTASDSDIDEAFQSLYRSNMTKNKKNCN